MTDSTQTAAAQRLETLLVEREAQLRAILDALADPVLICDARGRIHDRNHAATHARITEREDDPPSLAGWFGVELGGRLLASVREALVSRAPVTVGDVELGDARDSGWVAEVVVTPLPGGERGRALVMLRDVSMQRRLERQVQHAARMDSLGQLSGGIAHDFNNLLNGMLGAAELLSFDPIVNRGRSGELIQLILDTAQQAADLTRKLLAFSRQGPRAVTTFDVHALIADAVALLRHSLDKRVEIDQQLAAERPYVVGDRAQIQSALLNLGVNANHAMVDGGRLELRTRDVELDAAGCAELRPFAVAPGPFVEIEVEDSGVGIEAAVLARIFEPFFTTKELGRGTGLGLSMVHGAVEAHGGAITAESEPGRGTRFRLLLPRAAEPAPAVVEPSPLVPETLRVLIVDDEPVVRRTIAAYFTIHAAAEILEAGDGHEALALVEQRRGSLDLVVLDAVMPKLSGGDCLRALRELEPALPVIVMSGYLQDIALRDLDELGVAAFLSKPFRLVALERAVAAALAGRRPATKAP